MVQNKEDRLGISVSLSANGNRLAVGAYGNSEGATHAGKVITYEFDGSNWEKIGNEIISSDELGYFGWRVKLSADGNILAVSCLLYTSPSPRDLYQSRMPSSA